MNGNLQYLDYSLGPVASVLYNCFIHTLKSTSWLFGALLFKFKNACHLFGRT